MQYRRYKQQYMIYDLWQYTIHDTKYMTIYNTWYNIYDNIQEIMLNICMNTYIEYYMFNIQYVIYDMIPKI